MYYVKVENNKVISKTVEDMSHDNSWIALQDPEVLKNRIVYYDPETEQFRGATEEEYQQDYENSLRTVAITEAKSKRLKLLQESDVLVLVDRWNSYSETKKSELVDYRQALRDLPQQTGFPESIVWPQLNDNT
jgi:hypothetical protein